MLLCMYARLAFSCNIHFSSLLNFSTAIYEIADTVYTGVDFCKRLCGVSVIRRCIDNPVSLFAFTSLYVHNIKSRAW